MTVDFCSNIENYTDDPIYSEVEQEVLNRISAHYFNKLFYAQVMNFNNVISLTENFVPIILAFYIGSWSDKFGRKPLLAFSSSVMCISIIALGTFFYLDENKRFEEFLKLEAKVSSSISPVKSTATSRKETNAKHNRYTDIG